MSISSIARKCAIATVTAFVIVDPVVAGMIATPVPSPLMGAGVPALAAFAAGYWVIRKRRQG